MQRWLKAGCFELLVAAIERAGGECRDCEREGSKPEPGSLT